MAKKKRAMTPEEEEIITQQLLKDGVLIYVPCFLCGNEILMRTDNYKSNLKYLCRSVCYRVYHKIADGWPDPT